MSEKPIDAEVVSEGLTVRPDSQMGPIGERDPRKMVKEATAMANALAEIITSQKLFSIISNRKYVLCEGWTTLGAMLGIITVEEYVKELPEGAGYEAKVKLIRAKDGGIAGGASAICTYEEPTWKSRQPYALRSMALTRATSKAFRLSYSWIMKLAGFEATPAEEMLAADAGGSKEAAQEVGRQKVAEYTDKTKSQAAGKVVEMYRLKTAGGVQAWCFVASPTLAILLENGLHEVTTFSGADGCRYMPDDQTCFEQAETIAAGLQVTLKQVAPPNGAKNSPEPAKQSAMYSERATKRVSG